MSTPLTESITQDHDKMVQTVVRLLEKSQFFEIRAKFLHSPFSEPAPYLGHQPDITAHDSHDRFYMIDIVMNDKIGTPEAASRWDAFAKHAKLHHAHFWIMTAKGSEEKIKNLIKKQKLLDAVKLIKGI